jgi:hypothetical protein
MSWNYRVIKRAFKTPAGYTEVQHAVYEVYYDEDGSVKAWSMKPTYIVGETLDELKDDLKRYSAAFDKPILDWDELEKQLEGE